MKNKEQLLQLFADRLIYLRKGRKLSIRQLAAASGLEYSQVQRVEKGKVNVAISTIVALAYGLDIPAKELLDFNQDFVPEN